MAFPSLETQFWRWVSATLGGTGASLPVTKPHKMSGIDNRYTAKAPYSVVSPSIGPHIHKATQYRAFWGKCGKTVLGLANCSHKDPRPAPQKTIYACDCQRDQKSRLLKSHALGKKRWVLLCWRDVLETVLSTFMFSIPNLCCSQSWSKQCLVAEGSC